jgi:DNA polymerase (family 10)
MTNAQIAAALDEVADILEFQGANQFRVRAYRNAARTIHDLTSPVASILADPKQKLTDVQGIGQDLAEKIGTLVATGKLPMLEELRAEVPETVLHLLRIPGLGPKKAAVLFKELKVTTLAELKAACEAQQVRGLKGFGEKTEQTILAGMALAETVGTRMYWRDADEYAQAVRKHMAGLPGLQQLELAGSYRRGRETVGDLDVLAVADDPSAAMDHFGQLEGIEQVIGRGDTKMSVRLASGLQVDLRVVPAESFGAALQYFTGSKDHNVYVRGLAKARGLKINEYGVFDGDKSIAGRTEKDVYGALGLPVFPPEMREARREFEWAEEGKLPKLVELKDLRGDLHMHTTATDGEATLEEMIEAARARGLTYIAITDHSKRVSMARGLNAERLLEQWDEIDRVQAKLKGFKVLKGCEVDILEKGGLDLPDDVLAGADWIVASIHYGQNQPRDQITGRMLEAIANPNVSAIAHPSGRIINRRKPYELDFEKILDAAAEHGKLLELNANPARLDLDDIHCAAARERGIPIVISTDAHAIGELDNLRCGVMQARRAGLTKADVANTRTWPELKKLLGK